MGARPARCSGDRFHQRTLAAATEEVRKHFARAPSPNTGSASRILMRSPLASNHAPGEGDKPRM